MGVHARRPRKSKKLESLYSEKPYQEKNFTFSSIDKEVLATGNLIPRLTNEEVTAITEVIRERFQSAEEQTSLIAEKMVKWEKQYKGEWLTKKAKQKGEIFLRKTKEQVRVVFSHITQIINDLPTLVTYRPITSSIEASEEEFKKAKLAEALVNYTLQDLLKFKEDILPQFLKSFLKGTMGVLKLTYTTDSTRSDFNLENIPRDRLYIDPNAKHNIKNAHWVIEEFGMPKREVLKRIRDKYWTLPPGKTEEDILKLPKYGDSDNKSSAQKIFDQIRKGHRSSIEEDELVKIREYWSSATNSLSDVYSVIVGEDDGYLLRYGEIPGPYKKHPYFARSYDPHEVEVDGEGLCEELEGPQKITNTIINLRIKDVTENIIQRVATIGKFFDKKTIEAFKNNDKFIPLSDEAFMASKSQENFRLSDQFFPLPVNTSTQELSQDLLFWLGQAKETTGVNDALAGNAMPRQVTLGQFNQTISRAVGVMMPVLLQIGAMFEDIGEALLTYYKDSSFFGQKRIIQITRNNSLYKDVIQDWTRLPDGSQIKEISPDDVLVDGTMTAVDGFEDQINKQITTQNIIGILQAISVNPDMYNDVKREYKFGEIGGFLFRNSGIKDVESLKYTEEEKRKIRLQEAQAQAIEERKEIERLGFQTLEINKRKEFENQSKAEAQIAIDQAKEFSTANRELTVNNQKTLNEVDADIAVNDARIEKETEASEKLMDREFFYEQNNLKNNNAVNINK